MRATVLPLLIALATCAVLTGVVGTESTSAAPAPRFLVAAVRGSVSSLLQVVRNVSGITPCKQSCWEAAKCLSLSYFKGGKLCRLSKKAVSLTALTDTNVANTKPHHAKFVVHVKQRHQQTPSTATAATAPRFVLAAAKGPVSSLLRVVKNVSGVTPCKQSCWEAAKCLSLSYFKYSRLCRLSKKAVSLTALTDTNVANTQPHHAKFDVYVKHVKPIAAPATKATTAQQTTKAEVTSTEPPTTHATTTAPAPRFILADVKGAVGNLLEAIQPVASVASCKQSCWEAAKCLSLSYFKGGKLCRLSTKLVTIASNFANTQPFHDQFDLYNKVGGQTATSKPETGATTEESTNTSVANAPRFTLLDVLGSVNNLLGLALKNVANVESCKDSCWKRATCLSFSYSSRAKVCRLSTRSGEINIHNINEFHKTFAVYERITPL